MHHMIFIPGARSTASERLMMAVGLVDHVGGVEYVVELLLSG